ncbi:4'-phosphopantetheinyl transferase family protein [Aquimarina sp. 2201CG5-10]|uniref:4'-phosphopantetheinyl transferase family protein n=1 Tax=Aquimarina callyspongiae TaxID=3098150 RepID=UPI002AB52719|nr:4'-phosphopantetheinyl transferase superfamily protein [Aquimarina sp. 2201CG5-10]MDY8135039.1 4'-phosphopantetheinyl transferase superfamily protein [Aquimarina sp. 2201CG5-10]
MPLYKTITIDDSTNVLIWKIEESFETLSKEISLTKYSQDRIDNMKSDIHRRGFLSVRHLLAACGYTDEDLFYDDFGKPHLQDQRQISITHSFEYAAIIISDKKVGIDIEKQREKIERIAHKFTDGIESKFVESNDKLKVRTLTVIWGAKESLYKLYATPGLSFEQHIHIPPFDLNLPFAHGIVNYEEVITYYEIAFIEFDGYTCVYALPYTG